jgi:hypothetical protein
MKIYGIKAKAGLISEGDTDLESHRDIESNHDRSSMEQGETLKQKTASSRLEITSIARYSCNFLLTLLCLLQYVNGHQMVMRDPAPTPLTTLATAPETESKVFKFSSGPMVFGYLCSPSTAVSTPNCIKLIAPDGTLLASATGNTAPTNGQKIVFQLRDSMKVYYAVVNDYFYELTLTVNSGVYTLTQTAALTPATGTRYHTCSYTDQASNYIYVMEHNTGKRLIRYDVSTPALTPSSGAALASWDFCRGLTALKTSSDALVAGSKSSVVSFVFMSKSTTGLLYATTNSAPTIDIRALKVDNSASGDILFATVMLIGAPNTGTIRRYNLASAIGGTYTPFPATHTYTLPVATTADVKATGILVFDMGTLQYLAFTTQVSSDVVLLWRANLTEASRLGMRNGWLGYAYQSFSGPYFDAVANQIFFGSVDITTLAFQSYYLLYDNCTVRGTNDVCTNCISGYYRNTTSGGGDCILPADFLPAHGINAPSILMSPCLSSGCQSCLLNYQVCLQCDLASGSYINITDQKCYTKPLFGPSKGAKPINATAGQVVACSDTNCLACVDNYLLCTQCNVPGGWYLLVSTSACVNAATMPAGRGGNTVTGTADLCSDPNCLLCPSNYQICTACNVPGGWYLLSTTSTCVNVPGMPAGRGANSVAGTAALCSDTHCLLCAANYQLCTSCNVAGGWYLLPTTSTCVNVPGMPAGRGANSVAGTAALCSDTNCLLCAANYQLCTSCNVPGGWYLLTSSSTCVNVAGMPAGRGANSVAGTASICSDTNCLLCAANYQLCTSCNVPGGWYLLVSSSTCVNVPGMPAGRGANSVAGSADLCTDTHCVACASNYQLCTSCNVGGGWYLLTTTSTCVNVPGMPAGRGANSVAGTAALCSDTNCLLCAANYQLCTSCNVAGGWYLLSTTSTCVNVPGMPAGRGANSVAGTAALCSDTNCLLCAANYQLCTSCNVPSGWYLLASSSTCVNVAGMPAGKGANSVAGTADLCTDTHCVACPSNYQLCTTCDTGNQWYLLTTTSTCVSVPGMPAGRGVNSVTGTADLCADPGHPSCTTCSANYQICITQVCTDTHCVACPSDVNVCTACDTGNQWYLLTASSTCVSVTAMPAGRGANTAGGTADLCADSHCLLCPSNYQLCTSCDTANGWYLLSTTSTCVNVPGMPAGRGANTVAGTAALCSDSNCLACAANYQVCTSCNTAGGWYLLTSSSSCVNVPGMPAGRGANTVAGTADLCSTSHCTTCPANYQTCTACDTGNQWYFYPTDSNCYNPPTMPAGKGPNGAIISSCTTPNCLYCNNTINTCLVCDHAAGYYLYLGNCITTPFFPPQYGVDLSTFGVMPCASPNCQFCVANIQVCTGCLVASGTYLFIGNCILPISSPLGWGPDLFTQLINPCTVPHCSECKTNRNTCDGCDVTAGYVLYNGACTAISALPPGIGANTVDGTVKPCLQENCGACNSNYRACDKCAASTYSFEGRCVKEPDIPTTYGIDLSTNKVVGCSDAFCLSCTANYQICTECDQANGYTLVNGQCQQARSKLLLKSATYITLDQLAKIEFEESVAPVNLTAVKISVFDEASQATYVCSDENCTISMTSRGFSITLKYSTTILKGTLYVEKLKEGIIASTGFKEFRDYPIKINRIYFEDFRNNITKYTKATLTMSSTTKTTFSLVGIGMSPAASIMLDKLLANFMYLELLTGPFLAYPDYIFKAARTLKIMPFNLGNPFEVFSSQTSCVPQENYVYAEYECNFLANYGDDMLNLQITLAINIVISLTGVLLILILAQKRASSLREEALESARGIFNGEEGENKEQLSASNKGTTASSWIEWISENYGIRYFIIHTRGESMKIICTAILNIASHIDGTSMIIGTSLSVFWICYYLLKIVFLQIIISNLYKNRDPTDSLVQKKPIKLKDSKLWFMEFYFENMYLTPKKWPMYIPVFELARVFLIGTALLVFANLPIPQHCIAIGVEVVVLVYILASNGRIYRFEMILDTITQVLTITYVVMKSISTIDMSESTRQGKLGLSMGAILIGLIGVHFLFALYLIVSMGISAFKFYLSKRKKTTRIQPKTQGRKTLVQIDPNQPRAGSPSQRPSKSRFLRPNKKAPEIIPDDLPAPEHKLTLRPISPTGKTMQAAKQIMIEKGSPTNSKKKMTIQMVAPQSNPEQLESTDRQEILSPSKTIKKREASPIRTRQSSLKRQQSPTHAKESSKFSNRNQGRISIVAPNSMKEKNSNLNPETVQESPNRRIISGNMEIDDFKSQHHLLDLKLEEQSKQPGDSPKKSDRNGDDQPESSRMVLFSDINSPKTPKKFL